MKFISPTAHGIIDYVLIVFLAISPALFDLTQTAANTLYVLAAGYLLIVLLTDFRLSVAKVIPWSTHGWLDLILAPVIAVLPWILGFSETGRNLFLVIAVAVFLVWLFTDWTPRGRHAATRS